MQWYGKELVKTLKHRLIIMSSTTKHMHDQDNDLPQIYHSMELDVICGSATTMVQVIQKRSFWDMLACCFVFFPCVVTFVWMME